MNILLTGAAGFIGSHTLKALSNRGDFVVGVDNLNNYYSPEYKKLRITEFLAECKFDFYQLNIQDEPALDKLFKDYKFDKVVHFAAQAGVRYSLEHPQLYIDYNISGFNQILESMVKYQVQDLVFASSSSVYGGIVKRPLAEDMPLNKPLSLYAASKIANEAQAHAYHYLYGLNCYGLRFFNVYGPWGRPDLALYKFLKLIEDKKPIEIYNQGRHRRDFTHVDDLVQGILSAIDRVQGCEMINLAGGNSIKLTYLVDMIELILGREVAKLYVSLQKGDIINTRASLKKAEELLNFKPQITFEHGVNECINWFRMYKNII